MEEIKNNLNRIKLIIECFCNNDISAEQMVNLINKFGIEKDMFIENGKNKNN